MTGGHGLRIVGIGDNVVDDYTHIRTMYPGGNALNVSVYASMLGCESAYMGVFGSDVAAGHVQRSLAEIGVDTSHCRRADGPNGRAILTIEGGERVFVSSNEGGVSKSVPMDFVFDDPDYLRTFSIMHTSAYSYMDRQLDRMHALCPLISYDFSDDFDVEHALSLCRYIDIGFFSCADRTDDATMDILEEAVNHGCTLAAATRGPHGAILFEGRSWFRQAPHPVTPTDTLGAGDAFISGFLVAYVGAKDDAGVQLDSLIKTSLEKAASFAASICQVSGAFGHGLRY
jgi:fructoselysine 6-kinase